jgi:hypothetical protein
VIEREPFMIMESVIIPSLFSPAFGTEKTANYNISLSGTGKRKKVLG